MSGLFVFKLGTTFPATQRRFGDFDQWTIEALGPLATPIEVIDVEHGAPLPEHEQCAGAVLTGSHSMVTDNLTWSLQTEQWLVEALAQQIPILGVCYGHQLLARAAGGQVDYHPNGREIGTLAIELLPDSRSDVLFEDLPESFFAHVTHAQSVLRLPEHAVRLAGNAYEPNHAFRLGRNAWGVQFHPEFTGAIMREYIDGLAQQLRSLGRNVEQLSAEVSETPVAQGVLRRFGELVGEAP